MADPPTGGCIVEVTTESISIRWDLTAPEIRSYQACLDCTDLVGGKNPLPSPCINQTYPPSGVVKCEWTNVDTTEPYTIKVRLWTPDEGWSDWDIIDTLCGGPTISSISWSPTGDYATIAAGASLVESVVGGGTTQLMLVATNPAGIIDPPLSDGEAILQIDDGDPFTVAEGDHFRFNDKEWWALNIICGPECDRITIADEVAEAEKIPKIGDEIQFRAAIDWHDQEMSTIKWYYAKAPGECFTDIWDLDWTEFARDTDMPSHTFEDEGDEEITFFMVTATNMDFATGTIDTLCGPIFNLWKVKPHWWDPLIEAIRTVNTEDIAHPIVMLSANITTMPGWTEPPFTCPICNQVFDEEDSELNYAKHLMSHITAFEYGWFGKL